jgi:hypothetical protein
MDTINLETEILRENERTLATEQAELDEQSKLDAQVNKVLRGADESYRDGLMDELGFEYKRKEAQKIIAIRDVLAPFPQNRIMSKDAIRATCIKYGLRFLPTRFFKGQLDEGIGPAMEQFKSYCPRGEAVTFQNVPEILNDGVISILGRSSRGRIKDGPQYYIAAPATEFVLQPVPKDPLLFARLTFDKFFLIHKWGTDLVLRDVFKVTTPENWNSIYEETEADRVLSNVALNKLSQSMQAGAQIGTFGSAAQAYQDAAARAKASHYERLQRLRENRKRGAFERWFNPEGGD